MDQAQHFGALNPASAGSSSGQAGEDFREGLDGTERASACLLILWSVVVDTPAVFALAQESAKRTKLWYESSEKARR